MPIRDVAAMNASLNNDYGVSTGPNAPASHECALFNGDPLIDEADGGGVELNSTDCPGYARVLLSQAGWPAAVDGVKSRLVTFPDATGEWSVGATHWALIATGEVFWDCGEIPDPLEVTGAGDGPQVEVTVFYDNNFEVE